MTVPDPQFWSARRVLVTGHTGFKGAWLCLWLASLGARVAGFGRAPGAPSLYALARVGEDVEHVEGDVRDGEAVAAAMARLAPDVVIHMAAQALVRRSFADPVETYATNAMGTVHVLEAVRRRGDDVRVVVVVSSDKCYENREWAWGYREDDRLGGHDPYSSSKACAELVTTAYRSSFFDGDGAAAVASARAGNVFGGGDFGEDRLLPDVFRAALAGAPIRVRNPHAVRPWQHVLNPLSGYLRLAERAWSDRAYAAAWNFGPADDDARPVRWIVERLGALWDEPLRWEIDPGPHPHEARSLKLDSSLARARLGWAPTWGLEAGLERTVAWHRAQREGTDLRAVTLDQLRGFAAA